MDFVYYDGSNITSFNEAASLMWLIYIRSTNIKEIYPLHDVWFETKVLPYLVSNERSILTIKDKGETIGYSIIKKSEEEHKICNLEILPKYRKNGYGKLLLHTSCQFLVNPIISCSDTTLESFKNILSECNFKLKNVIKNQYVEGVNEYYFLKETVNF